MTSATVNQNIFRFLAKAGVVVYLVLFVIAFGARDPHFLTLNTLLAVVSVSSPLIVVSAAMTMCLICAEVDLSVVGVIGLSSTLTALMLSLGMPWPLVVPLAVCAGGTVGMVNGVLTGHLMSVMPFFPSFFPTIATTALSMGVAEALLPSKQAIAISDPGFASAFGFAGTLASDVPILYALALIVIMHLVMTRTTFGYRVQAVGTSRRAARLVGINVRMTKFWVMTVSGAISGFGGVLTAGYFQAGYSQLGNGFDLDAIGAAVIGGTALFGGKGNIIASMSGVLVLTVLNTGLQILQVDPAIQLAAKGTLVVLAVAVDLFMRRRLAAL